MIQDTRYFQGRPEKVLQSDPNAAFYSGNQIEKFWSYTVPKGTKKAVPNPLHLILKLYQTGGQEMPAGTEIFVAVEAKSLEYPVFIGKFLYSDFFRITAANQNNREFAAATIKQIADSARPILVLDEEMSFSLFYRASVSLDRANANNVIEYVQDNRN